MSASSLVDKVVKGAIATAIAATETVEEVAESVARNAISAALTRPKRSRETSKPPFKFQTFKKTIHGRGIRDELVQHLQSYAILKHGGPLAMAGQIIRLPVDVVQYIMSFIRPRFAWHDRWTKPLHPHRTLAPLDLKEIEQTWLTNSQGIRAKQPEAQRGAFGHNVVSNREFDMSMHYSRFQFRVQRSPRERYAYNDPVNPMLRIFPQYWKPGGNNSHRINWWGSPTAYVEPDFYIQGIDKRNDIAFHTIPPFESMPRGAGASSSTP